MCATVMNVEQLTPHRWENECDVGVAMTYGCFPDNLSGFVALCETERVTELLHYIFLLSV